MGRGWGGLQVEPGRAPGLAMATVQIQREAREPDEGRGGRGRSVKRKVCPGAQSPARNPSVSPVKGEKPQEPPCQPWPWT